MTVALMWEAKATAGRGPELLAWAREREAAVREAAAREAAAREAGAPPDGPAAEAGSRAPLRRETFTAPGDRVLVITWWDAEYADALPELPDPPAGLAARPVHRWRFTQV